MILTQYYLDCLSQASYLVGDESTGRAVVVDPRRDVGEYLADAGAQGLTIELVVETHFHADFLSGHLEMAAATGAEIGYSSVATTDFPFRPLGDGERLDLGEVVLEFRHTPGHTPESMSIVVWERAEDPEPYAVLTGDTLFIGDVGRPDLLSSFGHSREDLAGSLYDSLHNRLMSLPDATRVFPGHGAGSACGKNLSTETSSTIGDQRRTNYAVKLPDKETFIGLITEGQPTAPEYFSHDAVLNRSDHALLDEYEPPAGLLLADLDAAVQGGAVVVDGRDPEEFARGHVVGSINIGLNGRYAEFAGDQVRQGRQVYVVYPLIEESEKMDLKSAVEAYEELCHGHLAEFQVALLHGRMTGEEKAEVMEGFNENRIQILVSTTVIEVGVDVPNATVMIIEHAERFGLAQLHQLRGRVGRGGEQSFCILISYARAGAELSDSRERLKTMEQTQDGFEIAEKDLEIRGPGEFFGTRQAGMPEFKVANLIEDEDLLQSARGEAVRMVAAEG